MAWSIHIGRFFGIEVYIHFTFVILLGFVGVRYWVESGDVAVAVAGAGFLAALFLCVLLHEFGHALVARRYGIKTRDITLLPFGGLARLERIPDKPVQELWVALAGPAVNIAIAALISLFVAISSGSAPSVSLSLSDGSAIQRLGAVNIVLAVFNMLPAFPMDGGRVLRALLALKMNYTRATQLAARLGQSIALGLGVLGLFGNPFLVLIAVFVWFGAAQEFGVVRLKSALFGIPLAKVMITDFRRLSPSDPLGRAVEFIIAGFQQDFPVVDAHGQVLGILKRKDLVVALAEFGKDKRVEDVMCREFQSADPFEMADHVLTRFQSGGSQTIPVVQNGRLVGLLTTENLGEFLMIEDALVGDMDRKNR